CLFFAVFRQSLWAAFWVGVIQSFFVTLAVQEVYAIIDYFDHSFFTADRLKSVRGLAVPAITIGQLSPALLNDDVWLDVAQVLDHYDNAIVRFASGKLNSIIHARESTLPLRVIDILQVGYSDTENRCWAHAFIEDLQTRLPDLVFE
ncbi:hypothetical protein AAVH_24078, partial [Aphelenchoides avenae]